MAGTGKLAGISVASSELEGCRAGDGAFRESGCCDISGSVWWMVSGCTLSFKDNLLHLLLREKE